MWVVDALYVGLGLKMQNLIGSFDLCVVSIYMADGLVSSAVEFHESNTQSNMSKKSARTGRCKRACLSGGTSNR